jgi:hypothetical protein
MSNINFFFFWGKTEIRETNIKPLIVHPSFSFISLFFLLYFTFNMAGIVSYVFSWIDFFIYIYIHIKATIRAVIFVANQTNTDTLKKKRVRTKNALIRTKTSYNPVFQKIPNEILIVIFRNMNTEDLYHCSTVSRRWNQLSRPILWKSPVPNRPILSCLPTFAAIDKKHNVVHQHQKSHYSPGFPIHLTKYGHAIKSIDLSRIAPHVTDCTVRHIIRSCPHLTSLNLSDCRLVTDEALAGLGRSLQVLILQNCRQLTDIGLNYLANTCHSLEALHLDGCHRITDEGIIKLVTASGNSIRRLRLSDCSRVTGLTLQAVARLCGPRLVWLDIARTKAIRHSDLDFLVRHCPNISRLNVSMKKPKLLDQWHRRRTRHQEEEDLEQLMDSNPLNELIDLLHQFNIQPTLSQSAAHSLMEQQRSRDPVSVYTVESIVTNLKKLEYLKLSHWSCLDDTAVQLLSVHSQCLAYLNLNGCQNVTKKGIKHLSDLCERRATYITLTDLMITPSIPDAYESDSSSWTNSSISSSSTEETLIAPNNTTKA